MKTWETTFNWILLFFIGGSAYVGLELAWRSRSHWTMFFAGGLCFILLIFLNENLTGKTSLWLRCLLGSLVITSVELITGIIVNCWLNWQVWDYSNYRLNFLGQISLIYSTLWFFLSAPIFWVGSHLKFYLSHLPLPSKDLVKAKNPPNVP